MLRGGHRGAALALAVAGVLTASPCAGAATCAPAAHPLVSEVLYDAVGDDSGCEFLEFFNPHDHALSLAGARIEAGDGSGPGRWTLRWTGNAGDSVPTHGRFVVGGAKVQPPPQALVTLDLQNGPDAVRVVWPDGAVEVVGYGALEFPEYACGAPAVDVMAGQSLARVPDDSDRGSNALDFKASVPSPGRPNQPARDLAIVPGSLATLPEQPEPGSPARVVCLVENRGAGPVASGEAEIAAVTIPHAGGTLFSRPLAAALSPGDTAAFGEEVSLAAGKWLLRLTVTLPGDERRENDADSLPVRAGPGPLELTEIQFHPARGEGEWVEVRNRSAAPLDLAAFTVSDRGSARGLLDGGGGALAPESLAILAQDREALRAAFAGLDPNRIWQARPWSSLNNSDDTTGVADLVVLRESDGTLCQRVAYSAAGVPVGTPLEWRDGGWWPASEPAGTPLSPPRLWPALARRFECLPRRVPAGGTARLAWDLPWPRARVSLDLYDLAGRKVARPLEEIEVPPRGERTWSAADVPPGVYVALARGRPDGSGEPIVESRALRIEGGAR